MKFANIDNNDYAYLETYNKIESWLVNNNSY